MKAIEYGTDLAVYGLLYGLLGAVFRDGVRLARARAQIRRRD